MDYRTQQKMTSIETIHNFFFFFLEWEDFNLYGDGHWMQYKGRLLDTRPDYQYDTNCEITTDASSKGYGAIYEQMNGKQK